MKRREYHNPSLDQAAEWMAGNGLALRDSRDLDPLLDAIGDARVVLLGEATHGTSEFYTWRHALSARLIEEKDFSFIAVEGDWPDCYTVNRYVRDLPGAGVSARDVLHAFSRWPTWMWANREVVALTEWLRERNVQVVPERRAGFYGLDVYSLWESMEAVIHYLERTDPPAAQLARRRYACFDPYAENAEEYARSTFVVPSGCEADVVTMLAALRRKAASYKEDSAEDYFNAEQNALVVAHAEQYYRTMVRGGAASWNVRDLHMTETLERLLEHAGPHSKAIVWEHNTHVGDARATDMAAARMLNVGQLMRERHGNAGVFAVGFGTHRGAVIAADAWGEPMRKMHVPPAQQESLEDLLHHATGSDTLFLLNQAREYPAFTYPFGHRAIGVVYDPNHERFGNYVPTIWPERYDAFVYVDHSHAVRPLHMEPQEAHELPETYPYGI